MSHQKANINGKQQERNPTAGQTPRLLGNAVQGAEHAVARLCQPAVQVNRGNALHKQGHTQHERGLPVP